MRSSTRLGGRVVQLVDDAAVGEEHDAVGVRRGDRVVGDHDDGLAHVVDGARRKPSTSAPRRESRLPVGSSAKTICGRLRERPGDGDTLLLTAGELGRPVREPVAEADGVDHVVEPRRSGLRPASVIGSVMFSCAVSVGTRLNAWNTNPMRSRRSRVSWRSYSAPRSTSPMKTVPEVSVVEPGEAVHQRRLAGAGGAHDRSEAMERRTRR